METGSTLSRMLKEREIQKEILYSIKSGYANPTPYKDGLVSGRKTLHPIPEKPSFSTGATGSVVKMRLPALTCPHERVHPLS